MLDLAKRLINENLENLNTSDSYLLHLSTSYDIALETVEQINHKYDFLKNKLNPKEIALAAGLHDIGRALNKDQLFHELRGAKYIEENGLKLGVANSLTDVYRIAQMFRSHFLVAEQFADENNKEKRKEFKTLDSVLLIPRSWQEAIVIYSDLSNQDGRRVSIEERLEGIKHKFIKADKKGLLKVNKIYGRTEKLKKGELKEYEIMRYGFI